MLVGTINDGPLMKVSGGLRLWISTYIWLLMMHMLTPQALCWCLKLLKEMMIGLTKHKKEKFIWSKYGCLRRRLEMKPL